MIPPLVLCNVNDVLTRSNDHQNNRSTWTFCVKTRPEIKSIVGQKLHQPVVNWSVIAISAYLARFLLFISIPTDVQNTDMRIFPELSQNWFWVFSLSGLWIPFHNLYPVVSPIPYQGHGLAAFIYAQKNANRGVYRHNTMSRWRIPPAYIIHDKNENRDPPLSTLRQATEQLNPDIRDDLI